ncbi:DegT/DnrJ/EryC1/StrS family aminotransferase [Kaarinaea lacus]
MKGTWPYYSDEEISAAVSVLRSGQVNYWTGDECRQFEQEFARFCNARYAVAVANGTVALELALRALGIGPGDEVIVPSRTFIASASCVVNCGAHPVFADVDPVSQTLTANTIQQVLSPRSKAIIAVHLGGWPCDMDAILELAHQHGLKVIEDCAQAHGAKYKGKPIGGLADAGAFSFCQDKIISTGGEGGMLVTNDPLVWNNAWSYKDHGKSYASVYQKSHAPGFRWLHESIGTNWRMTEFQAAIGRVQLVKLPVWHASRKRNASILTRYFQSIASFRIQLPPENIEHAYYKYDVFVKPEMLNAEWNRDRILQAINDQGIPCYSGPCSEVYLEKAFAETSFKPATRWPVAKALGETTLTFLVHPTLTEEEMEKTGSLVESVMRKAEKQAAMSQSSTVPRINKIRQVNSMRCKNGDAAGQTD